MDDKKLLFIVNPRAGKTKSLAPLFDAAAIYSEAGYLVSVRKTTHRGEATELAESLGPEFDVVVCHGGDGTLNETVNGVMRIPREYRPLVSYLPGGSTNDFAASLNISSNPAEAAASAMHEAEISRCGQIRRAELCLRCVVRRVHENDLHRPAGYQEYVRALCVSP